MSQAKQITCVGMQVHSYADEDPACVPSACQHRHHGNRNRPAQSLTKETFKWK